MQPGMCHVQGFKDGEDRGWLQVILTLLSPFLKQVTDAWKAWLFAIISFILTLFLSSVPFYLSVSGVGNCIFTLEPVLLHTGTCIGGMIQ